MTSGTLSNYPPRGFWWTNGFKKCIGCICAGMTLRVLAGEYRGAKRQTLATFQFEHPLFQIGKQNRDRRTASDEWELKPGVSSILLTIPSKFEKK